MRAPPRVRHTRLLLLACCTLLALITATGTVHAQAFGEFVPVSTDDSPLPRDLELKYVRLLWRFQTDLPSTPANMLRVLDQKYTVSNVTAHANAASFMNYNAPGFKKSDKLPDVPAPMPPILDVWCDWEGSGRIDHRSFPRDLAVGDYIQSKDSGIRLTRIGPGKVQLLVAYQGVGNRTVRHPKIQRLIEGKRFQQQPQEKPKKLEERPQNRPFVIRPAGSVVVLTDAEADRIVATLNRLPSRYLPHLRRPKHKIVLGLPSGAVLGFDPGVALLVRSARLSSQPLQGKKGFEIPIRKLFILHCRTRPPIREFAEMLGSDIDDPEVLDRFRRCPPVTVAPSEFELPAGCVIPSDTWNGSKAMYKWKNGALAPRLPKLWEVSFGADPEQKLTGLGTQEGSGSGKLIGHYYVVVDGRGTSKKVSEQTFSKTFTMSHSEYSRHLRSTETTMSMDVEVGVDIGVELGESFSLSETTKKESERGSSLTVDVTMSVEQKLMPPAGTLLLYKIPVLLSVDRILGTPKFTFDRQVSISPSASEFVSYRNDLETGLLKKVKSGAIGGNVDNMAYDLGEVISGNDLIVIRRFGLDDGRKNNHFIGTWREVLLTTGTRRIVDISQAPGTGSKRDGILTYRDGPEPDKPTYHLVPGAERKDKDKAGNRIFMGTAEMKNLRSEQVMKIKYEVLTGSMGPRSKIVIRNMEDDPIGYLVRVSGVD